MEKRKSRGCLSAILCAVSIICVIACAVLLILLRKEAADKPDKEVSKNYEVPYQEVKLEAGSLEAKYYFSLLTDEEKVTYQQIVQGIEDMSPEIYTACKDVNVANQMFQYILKDYPEFFWCKGSVSSTTYEKEGEETYTVMKPDYLYAKEEKELRNSEIEAAATACLSGVTEGASDYEKILYVYEYIVNTVDYREDAPDNQNIYSSLVNKESVCAGYSRAVQFLLERLNVFCTYVTGVAKEQEPHAWNLVKCDGEYYYLDATWGDPVYLNMEEGSAPSQTKISYDYMCCDYEQLSKTHTPDGSVSLPDCTSMTYNYYVINGMYYDRFDRDEILNAMNNVIANKLDSVVLKFSSEEIYAQAKEAIIGDLVRQAGQNLCEWYGLTQVEYFYQDDPNLNKITIYWKYE